MRLCGCPTPRRTPSLGSFVACWDSFSLTLSHIGRLWAAGTSWGIPGFSATHSLQSEVGKSGCDTPSAPTTFPFHARQIGDVLTAARAAKGCFPVWTRSAPSCRSSVSFMGMKMSSSPPPLNRQQVMDCEGTGRCAWSGGCGCQPQQSSFTRQHQGMPPRAPWPVEAGEGACSSPALTPGQGRHLWCGNCRAPCVSFLDNPAVLPTKQVSTSCTAVAPAPEEDHCR